MCEAVANCHNASVFHRDIKPENFIVTDGWFTSPDNRQERKVVVKLSDFGLSTYDAESADMDCGSAPYMSYGKTLLVIFSNLFLIFFITKNAETMLPLPIPRVQLMSGPSASSSLTCTLLRSYP
jgi:serine/threonine protein kinase